MINDSDSQNIARQVSLHALRLLSEDDAIAVIDEYLASGIVSYKCIGAYKIGFRDARRKAAELSLPYDSELVLHDQIMNLRVNNDPQ
jgi:hypothetical protein